ncbi:MAG: ABC transporter substrate-binding protein [Actinomycetota bacterium]
MAEATTIQTFLIADVRGYTLFTQERGDDAAAKLAAKFARIAREAVQRRGGSVIEFRGDEALAVFSSARQAVLAAVDLQERMVEETLDDPDLPLPVGIGLDAGEAVPVESGYRGGALNLAARLCGEARAGEILASRSVTHLARKVEGVRYFDRGRVQLKNLPEAVEIVRIVPEGPDPAERLRTALPPAGPPPRRSRRNLLVAAAVAVALIVAAAIFVVPDDQPTIEAGSVGLLDLSGDLEGATPVGDLPRGLARGAGAVWAVDQESRTVLRVNPSTFRVEERIQVGAGPSGLTTAAGFVWVTNTDDRTVSVIDPEAHRVVQTVVVGNAPAGIVAQGDRVWVTNSVDATVSEIDAATGDVIGEYPVGERPVAVTAGRGAVWVANATSGTVSRVVSGEGETQPIPVGRAPAALEFAEGSLWVANAEDGTVTRIDPATGSVTGTERVGHEPVALASAGGAIWVATARDRAVARIDTDTTQVTDVYQVGNEPRALTGAEDGVWVGVEASPAVHRGATLRLVSEEGVSIDPHSLDRGAVTVLSSVYDGLVTYRRAGGSGGTTIVPDLAVSLPVPTDDGQTYTFTLRDGIRYSNGQVLSPRDVVATFERILVGRDSYGRALMEGSELLGGDSCTPKDPGACDLSEGVVADPAAGTVTFHFVRPAPDFLRILATTHFAILPSGTPIDLEGQPVPGTGPYLVAEAGEDGSMVLERNPVFREWSADAQPEGFADRIEVVAGVDPHEQVAMVERGEADFGLDGVPADLFEELDRRASDRMIRSPFYAVGYVTMNTASHPFDRLDARRAVAYALDRAELARIFGETTGSAVENPVTCQMIPPNIPGYAPYCPFTSPGAEAGSWAGPDLSRARQLVQRSGTAGAEVVVAMTPFLEGTGREITTTLRDLGYRVEFRTEETDQFVFPELPPGVDVSFLGWVQDYPSAAQFLAPLLSCPAHDGGPAVQGAGEIRLNLSNFCDPDIDRRMQRALDLQLADPHASARAWEALDHDLVDLAPMVPYSTGIRVWFVSERASNVEVSPQLDVLISQIWVR